MEQAPVRFGLLEPLADLAGDSALDWILMPSMCASDTGRVSNGSFRFALALGELLRLDTRGDLLVPERGKVVRDGMAGMGRMDFPITGEGRLSPRVVQKSICAMGNVSTSGGKGNG